jgi:biopolymer transport protein ExbD
MIAREYPMRLPDEPEIPAQINIVPMIDVVFAILTFFIMSSLFLSRTEGLPVNLPSAKTAKPPQQQTKISITVTPEGQVSLNRKSITIEQVKPALAALVTPAEPAIVVVNADEKVDHGQVVNIMDQVRQVEGAKLAIATRRPRS